MPDRVVADVELALRSAASVVAASEAAVEAFCRHTPAVPAIVLRVRDHFRGVAAAGTWRVYSSMPTGCGVIGRVFASGRTVAVTDVRNDPDYVALGPAVAVEICAPLTGRASAEWPIGAFNVEWGSPVDVAAWQPIVEEVARLVSRRIDELGGPPGETRSEMLLRHATALSAATDEAQLLERSIDAARDVSGLPAAVVLLPTSAGVRAYRGQDPPGSFAERIGRWLSTAPPVDLAGLLARAQGHGASYTLGDPAAYDGHGAHGFEDLVAVGVRTMIAVPAGTGVLLVLDDVPHKASPTTVNQLELLGAHAWTALERMRTLSRMQQRATSDPLTGLRHHGPFGERLAAAAPGRTALLAIDVDEFKTVNDTYGHQVGDQVLVDLARALQGALRDADDLYRIGGDEFVAVLEVRGHDEAASVADRLCTAARRTGRTISVGVAVQAHNEAPELTLRRADTALYEAKRTGRDRVRLAAA